MYVQSRTFGCGGDDAVQSFCHITDANVSNKVYGKEMSICIR